MSEKIAIFGVGAMGCLFGSRLAPFADVTLVGRWQAQIYTLNNVPLIVRYPRQSAVQIDIKATSDHTSLEPVDVALVLTKSRNTAHVAQQIRDVLKPDGIAITLQNGLDNYRVLKQYVGESRASLGVTSHGATLVDLGEIQYGGAGDTYLATDNFTDSRIKELARLFERAEIRTTISNNIDSVVWGKLAVNAAINPLSAVLRMPNGLLVVSDWARDLMHQAANEVEQVAQKHGIELPFSSAAKQAEQVARLTGKNKSSMLQDVLRRAETEIENINGAVMRRGELVGVPTPINAMLYRMVKALDEMSSTRPDQE